jgi:hypothetical protein
MPLAPGTLVPFFFHWYVSTFVVGEVVAATENV